MTSFRDATIVVLEVGRDVLQAVHGLHELLPRPSAHLHARVGLHKNSSGTAGTNDYIVGAALDDALAAGQDLLVSYPFAEGTIRDWAQAEALWKHVVLKQLGLKRAQNESAVLITLFPGLPRSAHEEISRIFFERLNFAAVSVLERPMAQIYAANALAGVVVDIGRVHTDITPVYDGVPLPAARCTLPVGADDCERHLAHLLRANTAVMAALADTPPAELQPALVALARDAWQGGLIKVGEAAVLAEDDGVTDIAAVLVAGKEKAVIESGMKKRANAKATAAELARARELEALDLVTLQFRGQELTLGKERHRFCDPLFSPGVLQGVPEGPGSMLPLAQRLAKANVDSPAQLTSLQDLVGHAVGLVDVDQRQYIYQGLFVTGAICAQVKGLGQALQTRLSPFILGNPDQQNDVQPRSVNVLKVPEHFAEYREVGDGYAAFLGASIVAKITFHDTHSKNFVAKADYLAKGPRAIIEMSPAML